MQIDHICRNKPCVNPAHLRVVTQSENMKYRYLVDQPWNKGLTECKRGHAYTEENTYTDKRGLRGCVECRRAASREYQRRKADRQRTMKIEMGA